MYRQCGTTRSRATSPRSNQCSAVPHGLHVGTTSVLRASQPCYRSSNGTLSSCVSSQQSPNAVYRVRYGLVAIYASVHLQPVAAHTRGPETRYRQLQCRTNTYSQTFFPSTICLWNTLPVSVCQLPPDSFKARLNTIQLM